MHQVLSGEAGIPEKDRKGVYDHLAKHYEDFGETPVEFREYAESELKELFPSEYSATLEETKQLHSKLDALEVSLRELKPVVDQLKAGEEKKAVRKVKTKRLIQLADKAIGEALRLSK